VPEGDVVRRSALRLHAALAGRVLTRSQLRWPSPATVDLTGREVLEVISVGKHLLARLTGRQGQPTPLTLRSHLRMEGSWSVRASDGPAAKAAARDHDVRAVLGNDDWTAIGHRLGMLDLVATEQEHRLVGHLGPDVLSTSWDRSEVIRRLRCRDCEEIGELLLDQRVLAGVGTFYMSEALFLRGRSPWTTAHDLSDAELIRLLDLVHALMTANLDRGLQITTGDARPGRRSWVHARSGRPCRRCGTGVRVAMIGEPARQRTAFYCPACQPGPAPTDDSRAQRPLGYAPPGRRRTRSPR